MFSRDLATMISSLPTRPHIAYSDRPADSSLTVRRCELGSLSNRTFRTCPHTR
jgi:hypothetical protein